MNETTTGRLTELKNTYLRAVKYLRDPHYRTRTRGLIAERWGQSLLQFASRKDAATAHIDVAIKLENGLFALGWLNDLSVDSVKIHLSSKTATSWNIREHCARHSRPDVLEAFPELGKQFQAGFYAYVPLNLAGDESQVTCVVQDRHGVLSTFEVPLIRPLGRELELTEMILHRVSFRDAPNNSSLPEHIEPALEALWKQPLEMPTDIRAIEFGTVPSEPVCSVIVPIYGAYHWILGQLSAFAQDPGMSNVELIYVLDDPRLEEALIPFCGNYQKIFQMPFKLVHYGKNMGFASANNIGARFASSETLLLLNSDALPSTNGWLDRMLTKFGSIEDIGALGCLLCFEDETIQHVGMSFRTLPEFGDLWLNDHPDKGMPPWLSEPFDVKEMPAATAACLMLRKDTFHEVGGLDNSYIMGDFEDSDLCLKLHERGLRTFVLGSEKLYHLERQSQSSFASGDVRVKLTLFNAWRHHRRWHNTIESIVGTS